MRDAKPSDPHEGRGAVARAGRSAAATSWRSCCARGSRLTSSSCGCRVSHPDRGGRSHRPVAVPTVRPGPAPPECSSRARSRRSPSGTLASSTARQSAGERRRLLADHQVEVDAHWSKGRGQDRDRRRTARAFLRCWSSSASRLPPRARPRASAEAPDERRQPAWGSASSSPRLCSNGPARRLRSPTAPNPRPERWSPSCGRDRDSSECPKKPSSDPNLRHFSLGPSTVFRPFGHSLPAADGHITSSSLRRRLILW